MESKFTFNRTTEPGTEQGDRPVSYVTPIRPVNEQQHEAHVSEVEVLKVSGKSRPSSVAGAIAGVIRQTGRVEIQAIGAGATNQAIKAVAIARGYLISSGIDIVCIPAFIDVLIDDEERTAIKLLVERRPGFSGSSTSPVMQ
ncbi:MAG: stage V sporulation protein S [Chloroflexi bacterium]|uniref:Stage V sporulation protein S n=1 Tax=Candidatus Chlorohelix allophototropha TaxID=3003348 RepID=A0A8T7M9X2_9CHLR|nr:stage V sporulation protein S [Chloroflexota bacterium]